MANTNTLTAVQPSTKTPTTPADSWRERLISDRWLFRGETEDGRRGRFLRLDITGLYTRRAGPFPSRAAALECLEQVLEKIVTEPLLDMQNNLRDERYDVLEGIPRLKGR